jgi:hypothetical protein
MSSFLLLTKAFRSSIGGHANALGLATEFRSEKIPRNSLGTDSVIPRKKVLIPTEFRIPRKSPFRSSERNGIPRKNSFPELTEIVSQSDEKRTTIVYQLFDNCSFFAKKDDEKDDGRRELPVRGADGKFHIDGKLETREDLKRMVSSAIPLLRAGGQCRKLVLTPGCRYRYNPCCLTKGHCSIMRERIMGSGWKRSCRRSGA